MYRHILIASDGSDLAGKAVAHGLDLAKAVNAQVTVVTVSEPMWSAMPGEMAIAFPSEDYEKATKAVAKATLSSASDAAAKKGVNCAVLHVRDQFPADGIIVAAKDCRCDLIVMASHGRRGLAKLVLGSEAVKVVSSSAIPVLIYRSC